MMTEASSFPATHQLPHSYAVPPPPAAVSSVPNGKLSPNLAEEEEEYTIKCICGFSDDDGSTVLCEICDTWQHTECYYPGRKLQNSDVHACQDCDPNSRRDQNQCIAAKHRQIEKRQGEQVEGGDRKVAKRPSSKSHKKKHRDTISEHPNGHTNHERQASLTNGRDQPPPAKKAKTSHRASGSIASINGNPHAESRKRAHSNVQSYPSPSKSPQETYRFQPIPRYTSEFLDLYSGDQGDTKARRNELSVQGANCESTWKTDPSLVVQGDGEPNSESPFVRTTLDFEHHAWPYVAVETKHAKEPTPEGRYPTWKLLRLRNDVRANTLIGEVRGEVGSLDEYCRQLTCTNRWHELKHPDPFVFFHQHINIYIDSRRSGTQFRYIRRSCDHNVTLRSFIDAADEVHHCFVANKDIPAGTELKAAWYFDPTLFHHELKREDKDQLYQERCECISRLLANFGDCACSGNKCPLEGYDRRSSIKSTDSQPKPGTNRKKTKKTKHAISPLSTGQATNSRAGSEALKAADEDDDVRSTSGSSKSGLHSRDLTPHAGLLDADPIIGSGLTARELRKIQALERSSKEQNAKGEKKQKKRPSGGSQLNTPTAGSSKQLGHSPINGDAKQYSTSPPPLKVLKDVSNRITPTRTSLSKPARPTYATASVQTEPDNTPCTTPMFKRRKFSTPEQRLLRKLLSARAASKSPSDTSLEEAPFGTSSTQTKDVFAATSVSPPFTAPSTVLPSQAAHTLKTPAHFKTPAPRLNLSTLPPVPAFPSNTTSTTPGSSASTSTPSVITPTIAQSPGGLSAGAAGLSISGAVVTPSPAKKKLSLGDYMNRRKESATPSSEKPPPLTQAVAEEAVASTLDLQMTGTAPAPRSFPDQQPPTEDGPPTEPPLVNGSSSDVQMEDTPNEPVATYALPGTENSAKDELLTAKQETPPASATSASQPNDVLSLMNQAHTQREATQT